MRQVRDWARDAVLALIIAITATALFALALLAVLSIRDNLLIAVGAGLGAVVYGGLLVWLVACGIAKWREVRRG